jgi:hypothetical protein
MVNNVVEAVDFLGGQAQGRKFYTRLERDAGFCNGGVLRASAVAILASGC